MKIKMLKDCQGSNCGKFVSDYKEGEVYDLSDSLANSFVEQGCAVSHGEKSKEPHANKANDSNEYSNKADKPKAKKKESE